MSRKKKQQPEKQILELLATHSKFEQYKMGDAAHLAYPTVIKYLKQLEANNFLRYEKRPSLKNGPDKKIYAITLAGLLEYFGLAHRDLKEKDFDDIAAKHSDLLPLLFDKWQFFTDHGIKSKVIESFKDYLEKRFVPILEATPKISNKIKKDSRSELDKQIAKLDHEFEQINKKALLEFRKGLNEIDQVNVAACILFMNKTLKDFLPIFRLDNDLSAFADAILEAKKWRLESEFKQAQEWLSYWNSLKNP
jgi:DNA-binding PadR family transcriptional regulator